MVSNVKPGYLRELLPTSAPETGEKWEDIQKDIEAKIQPGLTHWQSPNFMAWFPASSTYPGMLGELYSAAFTAPAFNWICSPAVTELETIVLDWLAKVLALPECFLSHGEGGGVIQGSASEAMVTVMVAARIRYLDHATAHLPGDEKEAKRAEIAGRLIALSSEQSHSSTAKGAIIAGVRYKAIHTELADDLALTGAGLQAALDECKAKNLLPFFLTTNLGATPTCAVDHFGEIADVLKAYPEVWVHVDAAYAGAALVCPEYQHLTPPIAHFDSFNMNMHKWLLTNFDASPLFIRRRRDLTDALSITPSYLKNEASESGLVTDYRDWQIPLGRRFRSLKIWFVMRTYGVEGMRAHIRRHIKLGEMFAGLVRERKDLFKIVAPPAFALTVIQVVPRGKRSPKLIEEADGKTVDGITDGVVEHATDLNGMESGGLEDANRLTKEVYELVNSRGEIFLTSGAVNGIYAIRVVSANPKADEKHVRNAFEVLRKTAEEVLGREEKGEQRRA